MALNIPTSFNVEHEISIDVPSIIIIAALGVAYLIATKKIKI